MNNLSNEEYLHEMMKLCIERVTEVLAQLAEQHAETLPKNIDGKTALRSFAVAIRKTNSASFTTKGGVS